MSPPTILVGYFERLMGQYSRSQPQPAKTWRYFAACMDESAVERLGASPIKPYLAQIEHLESKKELPALLAQLHLRSAGDGMLFGFGSAQDYDDSTQVD